MLGLSKNEKILKKFEKKNKVHFNEQQEREIIDALIKNKKNGAGNRSSFAQDALININTLDNLGLNNNQIHELLDLDIK